MLRGFKLQEVHPAPSGSNPLWLEKRELKAKFRQYAALFALAVIVAVAYYIITDYVSSYNPNDSECIAGFTETGCPEGYKCVGELVPCFNNSTSFKYRITKAIFNEKRCTSSKVYKEICMLK